MRPYGARYKIEKFENRKNLFKQRQSTLGIIFGCIRDVLGTENLKLKNQIFGFLTKFWPKKIFFRGGGGDLGGKSAPPPLLKFFFWPKFGQKSKKLIFQF